MVFLPNYLSYSKLYFKNHFKYMGTSISIIILVLHIYSESILLLYQHINWSATIYLFKLITTTTDQLLVISLMKVKKSKVNYTVLFWHYEHVYMRSEVNSNRFEISLRGYFIISVHMSSGKVKLSSVQVLLLSIWPKWNFKPKWDFHVNSKCP